MPLHTARLHIRDWRPSQDAADAFAIYGDEQVMQWIGDRTPDSNLAVTYARLTRYRKRTVSGQPQGTGSWAVVIRADADVGPGLARYRNRVIGNVLLVPLPIQEQQLSDRIEIGWHFNPACWGHGFATEAAQAVMDYGFEALGLPHIYAVTYPENGRSQAVTRRLGMVPQGTTQAYHGGKVLSLFVRSR